jgi:flavodoxin
MARIHIEVFSRHGGTLEVAKWIAQALGDGRGHQVTVHGDDHGSELEYADAVILGAPLYGGRWTGEARRFVAEAAPELLEIPTWAFTCGCGTPAKRDDITRLCGADLPLRGHTRMGGVVRKGELSRAERLALAPFGIPTQDTRSRAAAVAWARRIHSVLAQPDSPEQLTCRPRLMAA